MARRKVCKELWVTLESLIPKFVPSRKGGRPRSVDDQAALNGINNIAPDTVKAGLHARDAKPDSGLDK
jgi:hypothetical protein